MSDSVFTKDAGRFLKLDETTALKETYRRAKLALGLKEDEYTRSEFFGSDKIDQLLKQPGCVGIRVQYGKRWEDENGKATEENKGQLKPRIFLTGVDARGKSLPVHTGPSGMKDDAGNDGEMAVGDGFTCPRHC